MTDRPSSIPEPDRGRSAGRLMTFRPPEPSPALIKALVPVNRVLCLGGVPVLRHMPVLRHVPGLRGLCDIVEIDLPAEDAERLRGASAAGAPVFFAPNHPEFFTDWMLDKELTARFAPLTACWATHVIVNGMGPLMQRFWLKNNLIAQIPGTGGGAGKAHSIAWARKGHGVLLHPEGNVGWHGDFVAPLFPGVIEMAAEACRADRADRLSRPVLVAPVVWKLRLIHDAAAGLAREMSYVEAKLHLGQASAAEPVGRRVYRAYHALLARDEAAAGLPPGHGGYGERQRRLLARLGERLAESLALTETVSLRPGAETDLAVAYAGLLRAAERAVRVQGDGEGATTAPAKPLITTMRRLLRFRPGLYPGRQWTQEHIAECIKRLRYDYCSGSLRDTLNRFVPRPAGSRVAHIRVPEPIDISRHVDDGGEIAPQAVAGLVDDLRMRMQGALDAVNREIGAGPGFVWQDNPFFGEL